VVSKDEKKGGCTLGKRRGRWIACDAPRSVDAEDDYASSLLARLVLFVEVVLVVVVVLVVDDVVDGKLNGRRWRIYNFCYRL